MSGRGKSGGDYFPESAVDWDDAALRSCFARIIPVAGHDALVAEAKVRVLSPPERTRPFRVSTRGYTPSRRGYTPSRRGARLHAEQALSVVPHRTDKTKKAPTSGAL
jgi:hypothetical protein